ncbi:metabolite/H+ symporter [Brevibacillus nitrificans]|uniref:metabolite/H+ symporter n=1 Tax=Brevibacillus nitrificans TaxID=651560 RepID=UPI00285D1D61|nr:metabolite/H+ symporter [Brevibacillus nitrificans]MDR7316612.1 MHS family proline/betaine transporter-like MFS transporter [Brevibacillus nitrificans]
MQPANELTYPSEPKEIRKAVIAGAIGNVLEMYDWAIYGLYASIISNQFFPATDPTASLLLTFAVFAVGFIMRPLGSLYFGPLGDRVGRKKALSVSVIMMAIGTVLIGILPDYNQIGIAAPLLLVLARLIQGFSAGGEWGGSTTFLVEYAPKTKRGLYGSFQQVSTAGGVLLAALVSLAFSLAMTPETLESWGWRLPFIIGVVPGILGLYLRLKVDETPKFKEIEKVQEKVKMPLKEIVTKYPIPLLKSIGFTIHWTVSYYIFINYMPAYMNKVLNLPYSTALAVNVTVLVFFIMMIPIMGALSDRYGRKPLLIGSCLGFIVLSYPMFLLIGKEGILFVLLPQLVLAIFESMYSGTGPTALAELFPTKVRNTALSVGYNLAVAIFGGTAPFIATYMISVTESKISPTYYLIACSIVTLLVLLKLKETKSDNID